MEFEKLLKLIDAVAASGFSCFELEENGMKVKMTGQTAGLSGERNPEGAGASAADRRSPATQRGAAQGLGAPEAAGPGTGDFCASDKIVKAPLVGTFYSAPSEDAETFVQVGDTVKKGQVLGIIEAMKLMNEIESEYDGIVDAVLIENEQVVEYGQPLFRIR